jgi:NAD(P)H dehydrogenase (quinone)
LYHREPLLKTLIVTAHPRSDSLTSEVAKSFASILTHNGHIVEHADLVAERFDPVLRSEDEPIWSEKERIVATPDVLEEMKRVERNAATVMIYPVWWWSLPAILKGWIDRVWTQHWAYGARKYPHRRVWMLGVAGVSEHYYSTGTYDAMMRLMLETGLLKYCDIAEPRFELLFDSLKGPAEAAAVVTKAQSIAKEF